MGVNVYGRLDGSCDLCEAAKDKLKRMGVPFQSFELAEAITLHDGWRDDETVAVMACYSHYDTYPIIVVDGVAVGYPQAMKLLKRSRPKVVKKSELAFPVAQEVMEESLALAM